MALTRFRLVATSQVATGTAVQDLAPAAGGGDPPGWTRVRAVVRAPQAAVTLVLGFGEEVRLLEPVALLATVRPRALATLAAHAEEADGRVRGSALAEGMTAGRPLGGWPGEREDAAG